MSKILRRPMFRGGRVDSRGTGITSGLGYARGGQVTPKRGLVDGPGGYAGERNPYLRQISPLASILANPVGDIQTGGKILGNAVAGSGFGFMSPSRQFPRKYVEDLVDTEEGANIDPSISGINKILKPAPVRYNFSEEQQMKDDDLLVSEGDISSEDVLPSSFYETLGVGKVDDKPYIGGVPGSDTKIKSPSLLSDNFILNKQNIANEELTLDEVKESLGIKKARQRDVGDMLGRASAAFLKKGARGEKQRGVTDALGDFMAVESASGPGRTEKIENAAATFMLKDKAQTKRDKVNIEQLKAKIDYQVQAGNDISLPKSILLANKSGLFNNQELAVGIQGAVSPNTGKNYNFKGVKNKKSLTDALPTAKDGDTFIIQEKIIENGTEKTFKSIVEIIKGKPQAIYRLQ